MRENAEVVIERMVLLHHDNDVVDVLQVSVGEGWFGDGKGTKQNKRGDDRDLAHDLPPHPWRDGEESI